MAYWVNYGVKWFNLDEFVQIYIKERDGYWVAIGELKNSAEEIFLTGGFTNKEDAYNWVNAQLNTGWTVGDNRRTLKSEW